MKDKMNRQTWLKIERANMRWNGAMKILGLIKRGVPGIDATERGGFALQQKYGI